MTKCIGKNYLEISVPSSFLPKYYIKSSYPQYGTLIEQNMAVGTKKSLRKTIQFTIFNIISLIGG